MWKLLFLSTLAVGFASNEDLHGEWVPVAFYPVTTYIPACLRVSFTKDLKHVPCACADGKNVTVFEFNGPDHYAEMQTFPVLMNQDPDDIEFPSLNVSCKCGDLEYRTRKAAIFINTNYFILYETHHNPLHTEMAFNYAQVFSRDIPTYSVLNSVLKTIEGLKGAPAGILCTQEYMDAELRYKAYHRQVKSTESKIRSPWVSKFT